MVRKCGERTGRDCAGELLDFITPLRFYRSLGEKKKKMKGLSKQTKQYLIDVF